MDIQGHSVWSQKIRGVLVAQTFGGVVACIIAIFWFDVSIALGVAYGIMFSIVNTYWLARRVQGASEKLAGDATRILYMGAVLRFLFLLIALFTAHIFGLHLLAVASGLFVAHISLWIFATRNTYWGN